MNCDQRSLQRWKVDWCDQLSSDSLTTFTPVTTCEKLLLAAEYSCRYVCKIFIVHLLYVECKRYRVFETRANQREQMSSRLRWKSVRHNSISRERINILCTDIRLRIYRTILHTLTKTWAENTTDEVPFFHWAVSSYRYTLAPDTCSYRSLALMRSPSSIFTHCRLFKRFRDVIG